MQNILFNSLVLLWQTSAEADLGRFAVLTNPLHFLADSNPQKISTNPSDHLFSVNTTKNAT